MGLLRSQQARLCADLEKKIVLLAGPRQAGKTTLSKQLGLSFAYLNFDSAEDRKLLNAKEWSRDVQLVIFDELHKMHKWKAWLKGIYDTEGVAPSLLVTGSARLEVFGKAATPSRDATSSIGCTPSPSVKCSGRLSQKRHCVES